MSRTVEMVGFQEEPASLRAREMKAVERVLESGSWILGPEVAQFESDWAAYVGTQYACGVANGLDALKIGLLALGIGSDDEVLVTPMTAMASVLAIVQVGAVPVLIDVDSLTGQMDPERASEAIGPRTKAIMLVHLFGRLESVDEWIELSQTTGIPLIEDCAQAHGATWRGRRAGSFGVVAAYSFYPTKNLGAAGDAGAVVTNSTAMDAMARVLRNYGQSDRYTHDIVGFNSRLDEVQAAILRVRLEVLDEFVARRREIAQRYYDDVESEWIELPSAPNEHEIPSYHQFVLRSERRDDLRAHLAKHGVASLIHYPVPAHRQPFLQSRRWRAASSLEGADTFARTCLSIPCHPTLTDDDVDIVIGALNGFT